MPTAESLGPPLLKFVAQAAELVTDSVAGVVNGEWGFKNEDTLQFTHGIHPYPARMVPQVARRLLTMYSDSRSRVWDPFCGSGTVLLESMIAGRHSTGTEINPFACMIAEAKTTPISRKALSTWSVALQRRLGVRMLGQRIAHKDLSLKEFSLDVDYWFPEAVQAELTHIRNTIQSFKKKCPLPILRLMDLAFARAIRESSYQLPNEFKRHRRAEDERSRMSPDPIAIFLARWTQMTNMVAGLYAAYMSHPKPEILNMNCLEFASDETIDLIITSPPYGDSTTTVAYGQFSSLMMEWLDFGEFDWRRIDEECIGGDPLNPMGTSSSPILREVLSEITQIDPNRAQVVKGFMGDMHACLKLFKRTLHPGGHACIVIGDRRVRQVLVPNAKIIAEDAVDLGFEHIQTIERRIFFKVRPYKLNPIARTGRKVSVPAIGKESIVVLRS